MKNSWLPLIRQRRHWLLFIAVAVCCGCANTRIELNSDFPAPLVTASPMRVAIVLSPELTNYVHSESVARRGEYIINVGMVQKQLFQRLAQGTFSGHEFTTQVGATEADGSLLPVITELQFSTPKQTRTDYYEVWMRYRFDLYDQTGTKVGSWDLPAYGKANQANYSNDNEGLNAAAISACRDMAAMFSLNFANEPKLSQWIQSSSDGSARPKTTGSNQ